MSNKKSVKLYQESQQHIPGGVNSPVRAFFAVGATPLFIERAKGAYIYDTDGNKYIDYVGSWGPMILGHAHHSVVSELCNRAKNGLSFGAPTAIETQMAETLCRLMPSLEKVRMVCSGTEATMSAIRLARGYTKRNKIIKFDGCYHGHADSFLIKAGSGLATFGEPTSAGVPQDFAKHTISLPFNCIQSIEQSFAKSGSDIACVIIEPIAGNMNCILADKDFLLRLRQLCYTHGALLIFDEVMTGFRVALGGAQEHYKITPDLTTLGKIIGGGMPVGAFGGKREIMDKLAPIGNVYQAGTLAGNPVTMAAGLATLSQLNAVDFYANLEAKSAMLCNGLTTIAAELNIDFSSQYLGGMFGFFFNPLPQVSNFEQAEQSNTELYAKFFHAMLARGVYFAPSAFEAGFMSQAHSEQDIKYTLRAAKAALASICHQQV